MAQGSCWCTLLDTAASAHGPGVVLKRKGTTTALAKGTCPPPHPTLPYITPVLAFPIGQTCSVHIELASRKTPIYRCDLAIAQKSPLRRQNVHQATLCTLVCRPSEPSKHPRRASYYRCQSSHLHRAVPFPVYCHARLYIRMAAGAASRAPQS